ncbi:ABC transporter ATP-binding protein [Actinosynnema sp. NPDC050801]|uniref:ABC transporter ATP-binding protein n=1 Tax=unclassified Actinosynnema TaxID=2637065 RepID=UPI0033F7870B
MSARRFPRYVAVWLDVLRRCHRVRPGLTRAALLCRLAGLVTLPATGLAAREAIDASGRGVPDAVVVAAVVGAVAFALNATIEVLANAYRTEVVSRVGLTVLDAEIVGAVCALEDTDHLEKPEYLDRVTVLRGAAWSIVDGAWGALDGLLNLARLGIVLLLLGTVHPALLGLLAFAAIPLWFDVRGRRAITRAEVDTAWRLRLHRQLFSLLTSAHAHKEVRLGGTAAELVDRAEREWDLTHRARVRAQATGAAWRFGGWVVFTAGFVGTVALVVHQARVGHASAGDVVLLTTIAVTLRTTVQRTVDRAAETAGAGRLLEPYLWLRAYAERHEREGAGVPAPDRLRQGIGLHGVGYRYPGTGRDVLHDVTVDLPAGSTVAIVGEYGSGKSTLVKLLCGFHRPTSGTIRVDGEDLDRLDRRSWWRATAAAFQDFGRFEVPFREAVGLGDLPRIDDRDAVREAVVSAGGAGLLERLPDGLDTRLGRAFGGLELSEGQWQKTALARASMRPAPVLFVLDEPTASLDAPSEREVFGRYLARARAVAAATGGVTVVVSHRFSTVADADLILVLEGGRLVQSGTHAELMARGGGYADLFTLSEKSFANP